MYTIVEAPEFVATMPKFVVTFSQNPVNLGSLHSLSYLRSVDNYFGQYKRLTFDSKYVIIMLMINEVLFV